MAARQPPAQPTPAAGAAAAAPGAHPQYALPKYTPEEYYVQQKQATEIQRDTRSLNALDTTAPFVNLQDAVVRLLPFHLFNAADPAAADLDDTPDHMGEDLMASRHEAWEELCVSKATDLRRRADAHSNSIAELEARMNREALSGTRSIDQYAMAKVQQEDLKQKIATDKAALAKLTPPAPAVAVGKAGSGLVGLQAGAVGSQSLHAGVAAAAAAKASAAAAAAGRVAQPIMVQGGLGVLQQQQLLLQHQLSQLPAVQQQLAFQMLQQRQMQPAYQAALQQQQQQQQLLNLLAAQKKTQP